MVGENKNVALDRNREHFEYLQDEDANYTMLDWRNTHFKEAEEINQVIELALAFSLTDKTPEEQILKFYEHLTGEKINLEISFVRKQINQIVKLDEREDVFNVANILLSKVNDLNKNQKSLFKQFVYIIADEVHKIKESKSPKKKKQTLQSLKKETFEALQARSIEKVIEGIGGAIGYWENVFQRELPARGKVGKALFHEKTLCNIKKANKEKQLEWVYNTFRDLQKTTKGCEFLKVVSAFISANQLEFFELEAKTEGFERDVLDENGFIDRAKKQKGTSSKLPKKKEAKYKKKKDDDESFVIQKKSDVEKNEGEWRDLRKGNVYLRQHTRAKDLYRRVTKLLNNVAYSPQEAIQDGIGLRFEVQKRGDAVKIIKDLLGKKGKLRTLGVTDLLLRSRKLVNDQFETGDSLSADSELIGLFDEVRRDPSHKAVFFEDVRIVGNCTKYGRFEIQFVLVGNQNESGLSHHKIWDQIGVAKALARDSGFVTEAELQKCMEKAFVESTDEELVKEELKRKEREKTGKRRIEKPHANVLFAEWSKERKTGILKRLKKHTIEVPPEGSGKYVYIDPEYRFKYRLIDTPILKPKEEKALQEVCFEKWLNHPKGISRYFIDGLIPLCDLVNPKNIIFINANSFEEIPDVYKNDLKERWMRENQQDKIVFKHMEKIYEERKKVKGDVIDVLGKLGTKLDDEQHRQDCIKFLAEKGFIISYNNSFEKKTYKQNATVGELWELIEETNK